MSTTLQKEKLKEPITQKFNLENGARFANFGGWNMPTFYTSIIEEYKATRENIGLFDVSHMGRWWVTGKNSEEFLNYLVTNDLSKLKPYRGLYTPMCNEAGGIVDDLIIYKINNEKFLLVDNAGNHETDSKWYFQQLNIFETNYKKSTNTKNCDIRLEDITNTIGQIAIQGPNAQKALDQIFAFKEPLKYFSFAEAGEIIVTATGYTGELGYELYGPADALLRIWDTLIKKHSAKPCGLGSRDLLRLEAGYCLHGNDIDANTTPYEAGIEWTVKLDKENFIGKEKVTRKNKKLIGLALPKGEKFIPRHNTKVFSGQDPTNSQETGIVTSGNFSVILDRGIALAYVDSKVDFNSTKFFVELRGNKIEAKHGAPWFLRNIKGKERNEILS